MAEAAEKPLVKRRQAAQLTSDFVKGFEADRGSKEAWYTELLRPIEGW